MSPPISTGLLEISPLYKVVSLIFAKLLLQSFAWLIKLGPKTKSAQQMS